MGFLGRFDRIVRWMGFFASIAGRLRRERGVALTTGPGGAVRGAAPRFAERGGLFEPLEPRLLLSAQIVTGTALDTFVSPGEELAVEVDFDTDSLQSPDGTRTTGLGFRLHFDSTEMNFKAGTEVERGDFAQDPLGLAAWRDLSQGTASVVHDAAGEKLDFQGVDGSNTGILELELTVANPDLDHTLAFDLLDNGAGGAPGAQVLVGSSSGADDLTLPGQPGVGVGRNLVNFNPAGHSNVFIQFRSETPSASLDNVEVSNFPREVFQAGSPGFLGIDVQPETPEISDGDPETDSVILFAWQDINAEWPGVDPASLPLSLAKVDFLTTGDFDGGEVRFTEIDTAPGFDFQSEPATLTANQVGGQVWLDRDEDGERETGDSGLSNVSVRLFEDVDGDGVAEPDEDDGAFIAEAMTDASGSYVFEGITPGDYFLQVVEPQHFSLTQASEDSEPDPATGFSGTFPVTSGQDLGRDAGLVLDEGAVLLELSSSFLSAGETGQTLSLNAFGGAQVQGAELRLEVEDGASGPPVTSVDLSGPETLFEGGSQQDTLDGGSNERIRLSTVSLASGPVAAEGLLGTLTFDTTGFSGGDSFELSLAGVTVDGQAGDTELQDANGDPLPTVLFGPGQSSTTITLGQAQVVGRHLFHNASSFDGDDPAVNADDDGAIATGKSALLPGQTATAANYTSRSTGITGVMVDVQGLADPAGLDAGDFILEVGNSDNLQDFQVAPAPAEVVVREGAGADGSDRVTLTWANGSITGQWLRVEVRPTAGTGLAEADTFFFGSAPGEALNNPGDAIVNSQDELLARNNTRSPLDPAPIDFAFDFNRDRLVNSQDQIISRTSRTSPLTALELITAPVSGSGGGSGGDPVFASSPPEEDPSRAGGGAGSSGFVFGVFDLKVLASAALVSGGAVDGVSMGRFEGPGFDVELSQRYLPGGDGFQAGMAVESVG